VKFVLHAIDNIHSILSFSEIFWWLISSDVVTFCSFNGSLFAGQKFLSWSRSFQNNQRYYWIFNWRLTIWHQRLSLLLAPDLSFTITFWVSCNLFLLLSGFISFTELNLWYHHFCVNLLGLVVIQHGIESLFLGLWLKSLCKLFWLLAHFLIASFSTEGSLTFHWYSYITATQNNG
jgi:hypothetical protein